MVLPKAYHPVRFGGGQSECNYPFIILEVAAGARGHHTLFFSFSAAAPRGSYAFGRFRSDAVPDLDQYNLSDRFELR